MPHLETDLGLNITNMWQNTTWAAGHLGDAIKSLKEDSKADVRKDLGEALILLEQSTAKIRQHLATRD